MIERILVNHRGGDGLVHDEDAIAGLYESTYSDRLDEPFFEVDKFLLRIRRYAQTPGFEYVLALANNEVVGLALGYPLRANARWWRALTEPVEPELIAEDGTRTFALCELLVHPSWQGQGLGHSLHDELLFTRPERRATLTAEQDNESAVRVYRRWGWRVIGTVQPSWPDAPRLLVLVLDFDSRRQSDRAELSP